MELEELFSIYSKMRINKDDFFLVEQKLIDILLKTRNWNQLNEDEKKKAREDKVTWLISKIYKSTEYPKYVFYEQSLISFYNILIIVIEKIDKSFITHSRTEFTVNETVLIRLYAVLVYEMNQINSSYDLKKITHVPKEILDHLLNILENYYAEYSLNDLKDAYEKMMILYKSNPYNY
jgi:hypothetical protein